MKARPYRLVLGLVCLLAFVGGAVPAAADTTAQPLPFAQDWSNTGLITVSDDWSGVPGVIGYRGDELTASNDVNPQTVTADDGGVTEYRATVTVNVTFASLCALVQRYVDKEGVAQALCSKLEATARKADRSDQEPDLHAFVNQVEAQSGKSMTVAEAATLIRLAASL